MTMARFVRGGVVVVTTVVAMACAANRVPPAVSAPVAPRFSAYPTPEIPASLAVSADLRRRHIEAWARLQAGDLRGAQRAFEALLTEAPALYPAATGLGFVHLANEDYRNAESLFAAAVGADDAYLPAWLGRADTLLALGLDADAIAAMERIVALDPARESVRTRMQLLRFKLTQESIGAGQQARAQGRPDEAVAHFERALAQSPESTMILGELARSEVEAGRLDQAERHTRRLMELEPRQGDWQALLGDVLEARAQFSEAADAYRRADMLEPNAAWRDRGRDLRERAEFASLPEEFRAITSADTITRADLAAYIGIHLRPLVESAPVRVTAVATDVRTHWAASWILPVTRAGIMSVFPNHTFQPGVVVRRGDLATVMAALVEMAGAARGAELARWQVARPRFVDLPASNLFYNASALAAAAGVMATDGDGRFAPTRPATGADLEQAVRRIATIAGR